jgi:hypothetical protein
MNGLVLPEMRNITETLHIHISGYVFGGDVLRFFHGGDECLTIPSTWTDQTGQK